MRIYVHIYEELFSKTWSLNLVGPLQPRFLDWCLTRFGKELFKYRPRTGFISIWIARLNGKIWYGAEWNSTIKWLSVRTATKLVSILIHAPLPPKEVLESKLKQTNTLIWNLIHVFWLRIRLQSKVRCGRRGYFVRCFLQQNNVALILRHYPCGHMYTYTNIAWLRNGSIVLHQ